MIDSRPVVWCLSCKRPHPHRFYLHCPFCGSGHLVERMPWEGQP